MSNELSPDEVIKTMFPDWKAQIEKLNEVLQPIIIKQIGQGITEAAKEYGITTSFEVVNPEVLKWINKYTIKLCTEITTTTHDNLRTVISAGIKEGKTIKQLKNQIREVLGDDIFPRRAELIARTEVLRAQNAGRHEQLISAGAKRKIWKNNQDACPYCKELAGTVAEAQMNFFNKGDTYSFTDEDGIDHKMKLDYADISYPPIHPACRCYLKYEFE